MISTVEDIRREYALAYSASLPSDESAKLNDGDSVEQYVSWWCREYGPDMVKIARIAQEALTNLANGVGTEAVRSLAHHHTLHEGSAVVSVLLDHIEPLRSVLLSDPVDDDTFKRTMGLIVEAFDQPTS
jgi:hypothetical protein